MQRSLLTDTRITVIAPAIDVTQRLQDVIYKWRSLPQGYSLDQLYQDCNGIVGADKYLLPLKIILVKELDATNLIHAMKRQGLTSEFRADPIGRFESALIPVLNPDNTGKGFVLALDEDLKPADQVGLFAHAVAHLIKNQQDHALGQRLTLDPSSNKVHIDKLDELRYFNFEQNKDRINRSVLEAYPKLRELLEPLEESPIVQTQVKLSLEGILRKKKWQGIYVRTPFRYTEGRVLPDPNGQTRRGKRQSIDALLRIEASLPTAVLHLQRAGENEAVALRRVREAGQQLAVPFGYVVTEQREILEYDWTINPDATFTLREELPDRSELEERWFQALQLTSTREREALTYPFDTRDKRPRYYQEAAINKAIIATLQARRGLRTKRLLLTLATGTGKTQIAFQILWKLKQTHTVRNVMFIADRSYLLDQAQYNAFGPFGDALARGTGEIDIVHDILFASYQWLTNNDAGTDQPNYIGYPANYFDVIVIDECHRGSADENSRWRKVLEHFSEAVQIGLTATPLATKDVKTNAYFGPPIYTYSLSQGINDGYLAPYRVRRIQIGQQTGTATDNPQDGVQTPQAQEIFIPALPETSNADGQPQEDLAPEIVMETSHTMRTYTKAIAEHLASYLRETDQQAKTIIFCVDNEHANQMRIELEKACADFARPGDIVRIVDDDGIEGKLSLNNFCIPKERRPVLVTTARLLSTGIDVPTCKNIVLARGVGSIVEFKQIIGRGTRLYTTSTPTKNWFTILDYAGAIKHFFDRDFDGYPETIQQEELVPDPLQPDSHNEEDRSTESESYTESEAASTSAPQTKPTNQTQSDTETHQSEAAASSINTSETTSQTSTQNTPSETEREQDLYPEEDIPVSSSATSTSVDEPSDTQARIQSADDMQTQATSTEPYPTSVRQSELQTGKSRIVRDEKQSAKSPQPELTLEEAERQGKVRTIGQKANGIEYRIVGEKIYELAPDGHTLRQGSAREFAEQALRDYISTPEVFRELWLTREGQRDIIEQLESELVTPEALADALNLAEVDTFDLLLYVIFQQPPLTRMQRAERLHQQHQDFFQRFAVPPLASQVLNAILDKYIRGEAASINDPGLLSIQPVAALGTRMELSKAFSAGPEKKTVTSVLQEMQRLLYSF